MKWLIHKWGILLSIGLMAYGCGIPQETTRVKNTPLPENYGSEITSEELSLVEWRSYFKDSLLIGLIDSAINRNQELQLLTREIQMEEYEIMARKGEYLPSLNLGLSGEMDKVGRYTRFGALEDQLEIRPGEEFPEPFTDLYFGASASWEIDIWKKLRNAKESAVNRYLSSIEGRKFATTQLVAEIANSYYELMALDNLLNIINQNVEIQSNALRIVENQKKSAKVSQLAVNRFEAQLLRTQNLSYEILQRRTEIENYLRFLTGSYDGEINRNSAGFLKMEIGFQTSGIPSDLLINRPDIRAREFQLTASKLDVKVAKAQFYPSLDISAGIGFQAFNPVYLINPQSLMYDMAGDIIAPLINRKAIKANYLTANAAQETAIIQYEQTVLQAYTDVLNQLAYVDNMNQSFSTKSKEVEIMNQSINVATNLFQSARADYAEVLMTQREALEAKMELIVIKKMQMESRIQIYRALGGGWN
jgi:NodT family efflux transporter outer membrane factor (OMF) lipoprotein